jgi:hypothetical protein
MLLFFDAITTTEVFIRIPRGQLDYVNPDYKAINILALLKG